MASLRSLQRQEMSLWSCLQMNNGGMCLHYLAMSNCVVAQICALLVSSDISLYSYPGHADV
eukprot:scaffold263537_cov23-Prasinocladus_malaysianus.AAC.1